MSAPAREVFRIHRVLTPAGKPVDFEDSERDEAIALAKSYAAGSREDTPEASGTWTVFTFRCQVERATEVRAWSTLETVMKRLRDGLNESSLARAQHPEDSPKERYWRGVCRGWTEAIAIAQEELEQ